MPETRRFQISFHHDKIKLFQSRPTIPHGYNTGWIKQAQKKIKSTRCNEHNIHLVVTELEKLAADVEEDTKTFKKTGEQLRVSEPELMLPAHDNWDLKEFIDFSPEFSNLIIDKKKASKYGDFRKMNKIERYRKGLYKFTKKTRKSLMKIIHEHCGRKLKSSFSAYSKTP